MKIINTLLLLLFASIVLSAQPPAAEPQRPPRCRGCIRRVVKSAPLPTSTPAAQSSADFYVGEAKVDVTKDETVVRLAMAQHGSVLIELPANDGPRYIIPGDPEMATVDQKALERNKRAIVVRPGTQFVSPPRNAKARTPAATVTAQMRSGLVVTFLFYPVADLAQNVHRCVLSYNRDEVVARRRAVGLPVNLDTETRGELTVQSAAPISISVESSPEEEKERTAANSPSPSNSPAVNSNAVRSKDDHPAGGVGPSNRLSDLEKADRMRESETVTSIRDALQQAMKKPKQFKKWTRPSHGLALSILSQPVSEQPYRLAIVAVKNTTSDSLKLTPRSPDVFLEMVDDQGKALNIESIKKVHSEPSDPAGLIPPKATVYYAIAYVVPVLGAHQQIRLSIAHSNAADEPASIMLAKSGK
ncbi:MAG: hypothetical protein ACR2H4_07520 [Pyrinomonadaceae bacterium]